MVQCYLLAWTNLGRSNYKGSGQTIHPMVLGMRVYHDGIHEDEHNSVTYLLVDTKDPT